MFIEQIIIEGFKSYATRTVISGFDPYFNAITGLNGSGKSNILDSICFVLGISNLSQVRVGTLQELVYKQGQAGVTKATVTINFNNAEKKSSPVGYEHFDTISITRQVVIGGKNKYMINNQTVQASQVQNLFHSVQLNVNNPHFLIMQGRITKVLNMKPPEILGMIEEAAGTRMFENKRQAALRTIEKKQVKMDEINRVLANDITPTLERLRSERKHYQRWSANNTEIEKLERFCVAYQYNKYEQEVSRSQEEFQEMEEERDRLKAEAVELRQGITKRAGELSQIQELRKKDYEKIFQKAKAKEETLSKDLVKANTVWKNRKGVLEKEEKALEAMGKQAGNAQTAVQQKANEIEENSKAIQVSRADVAEKEKALSGLKQQYQEMCAGIAGAEGGDATLTEQIASTGQQAQAAKAEKKQLELRISHLEKSVAEQRKEAKKSEKDFQKVDADRSKLRAAIDDLKSRLTRLKYDPEEVARLQGCIAEEESAIDGLRQIVNRLSAQVEGRLSFEFKDPERGFDRSRVKGLIAKLVTLKDSSTATALEVVAGSRLYQVVVDNEQTGKLLLQKGGLKRRVTIIPLNKIARGVVDANRMRKAKQIAAQEGGQVHLAIELVGYEDELRAAMEYVFGSTLVCDSLPLAKALTFNKEVHKRTVTLDGDVFDPSGTLTGGSKEAVGTILAMLQELQSAQTELDERRERLAGYQGQLSKLEGHSKEYTTLSSNLDIKEHELRLLEERTAQSLHALRMGQVAEQEAELEAARKEVRECEKKGEDAARRHKQLKQEEDGLRKKREAKLKGLEKSLAEAKKAFNEATQRLKALEQQAKVLELEMAELRGENSNMDDQLAASEKSLAAMREEVQGLEAQVNQKRAAYEEASNALSEAKTQMSVSEKQIAKMQSENEKADKRAATCELEARKVEQKIGRYQKDKVAVRKTLANLLEKYPWIEAEKQFFGQRHTDYDFEGRDAAKAQHLLRKLEDEQQKLVKKINKKVMGMIEKAETEYSELLQKLQVIDNDKKKIENVIEELDVKKNEALERTWVKVNRDFGSIFSSLLPGTTAKLEPLEGSSVLDGLEVKVAFGNVWKETLTELSGGQRSLLALSLILALLLFKPAPMYILDEVDAALDLSHTQNIGAMLRTHFSHSQFLVVSLKEGMFNNANVIFRTKFIDGVSTVTRTLGNGKELNNKARAAAAAAQQKGEEEGGKRKKGKLAGGISAPAASAMAVAVGQEN